MKKFTLARSLFILILLNCGTALSSEREKLDGWGPFRFGMSHKEAVAAMNGRGIIFPNGNLNYPATVQGLEFHALVSFSGPGGRVTDISLRYRMFDKMSESECNSEAKKLITLVKDKYGEPDGQKVDTYGKLGKSVYTIFKFDDKSSILVLHGTVYNMSSKLDNCQLNIQYIGYPMKNFEKL